MLLIAWKQRDGQETSPKARLEPTAEFPLQTEEKDLDCPAGRSPQQHLVAARFGCGWLGINLAGGGWTG